MLKIHFVKPDMSKFLQFAIGNLGSKLPSKTCPSHPWTSPVQPWKKPLMNALYRQITASDSPSDGPIKPATSGHHTARRCWHVAQRGGSFRCCLIPTWVFFSDFLTGFSANKLKLYVVLQRFRKFSTLTLKVSKYETSFLKKAKHKLNMEVLRFARGHCLRRHL